MYDPKYDVISNRINAFFKMINFIRRNYTCVAKIHQKVSIWNYKKRTNTRQKLSVLASSLRSIEKERRSTAAADAG